jgi:hypothetical protein
MCPTLNMYQQVVEGMDGMECTSFTCTWTCTCDSDDSSSSRRPNKNYSLTSLSIGCESIGVVLSSDDDDDAGGASSLSNLSNSSLSYEHHERSAVLDDLRFVWQEPAYSEAANRLSFLLHLNKSGRRYLESRSLVPSTGISDTDTDTDSDRYQNWNQISGVDDAAQPWRAVWPEILHKFGKHAEQEQGASGIFHLLQARPGNLF